MDSIVQVVISRQTTVVSRPGFGVPLICAYHQLWPERVRFYTSLEELTQDGLAASSPVCLAATALLSQEPRVPRFAVGRRASAPTAAVKCTPSPALGIKYTIRVNGTPYEYTSDASPTPQEIVEGLAAAINAATWQAGTAYAAGVTVSNDGGKLYVCRVGGTSAGSGGPAGTAANIADNTCRWDYLGPKQNVRAEEDNASVTVIFGGGQNEIHLAAVLRSTSSRSESWARDLR